LLLFGATLFEGSQMFNDDQDDGQGVVFWLLGAVVTLLLGGIIYWKTMAHPPTSANIASTASTAEEMPISLESGNQPEDALQIPQPQPGDNLPKSLGELAFVFDTASGLTITGAVPTERKKERLLSQAQLVFGAGRVVDAITVAEGAALPNWKGKTLDLMAKLATVGPFQLALKDNQINFSAEVPDAGIKSAWIDWLANFFVDQPLAVSADNLNVNASLPAVNSFDVSTLFNLAINFESGSAEIPADAVAALDQAASILVEDGRNLRIVGHTDSTGDAATNRALSEARAQAVRDFLIAKGVVSSSLNSYGMGQDQPIAENDSEAGRAANRRIEFAQ
jgi:OOP family OmpA-OmpF porin